MIQPLTQAMHTFRCYLTRLIRFLEKWKGTDSLGLEQLSLLRDLLEMDMDNEGIQEILRIDLNDPSTLNTLVRKEMVYYRVLCKSCSKKEALQIILASKEHRLRTLSQLLKLFAYPSFLFGLSLCLMTVLGLWILPGLYQMIHTMVSQTDSTYLKVMQFAIGIEWSCLACLMFYFRFVFPKERMNHYVWMSHQYKGNIWKCWISSLFLLDFNRLIQSGFNLADILDMMRNMGHPILRNLMRNTQNRLKNGIPLTAAFEDMDDGILRLMRIQESERKISDRLIIYQTTLGRLMNHKLAIIAKTVLIGAYIQIAVIILIAYQMMFYPLKLLEAL